MFCLNEVLIPKRKKSLKEVEKSLDKFAERQYFQRNIGPCFKKSKKL